MEMNPNAEGTEASTHGSIHNTTGATLLYSTKHIWEGEFRGIIPPTILNGQNGKFLHNNTNQGNSIGALVYRAKKKDKSDTFCKLLLCWETPCDQKSSNYHAYCEILDDVPIPDWGTILASLKSSGTQHSDGSFGLTIAVNISPNDDPSYEAFINTPDDVAQLSG